MAQRWSPWLPQAPERPFGDILKALLKQKRYREKARYGKLVEAWQRVVPEQVAELTRIVGHSEGTVVIEVTSSALMQELAGFMKPLLLEGLRAEEGAADVVSLEFRLGSAEST